MSSDNFMYVYQLSQEEHGLPQPDTLYVVAMRFASADYEMDSEEWAKGEKDRARGFFTMHQAIEYANRKASGEDDYFGMGTEYGVTFSKNLEIPRYDILLQVYEENPIVRQHVQVLAMAKMYKDMAREAALEAPWQSRGDGRPPNDPEQATKL